VAYNHAGGDFGVESMGIDPHHPRTTRSVSVGGGSVAGRESGRTRVARAPFHGAAATANPMQPSPCWGDEKIWSQRAHNRGRPHSRTGQQLRSSEYGSKIRSDPDGGLYEGAQATTTSLRIVGSYLAAEVGLLDVVVLHEVLGGALGPCHPDEIGQTRTLGAQEPMPQCRTSPMDRSGPEMVLFWRENSVDRPAEAEALGVRRRRRRG
jgi:hypothetical protein